MTANSLRKIISTCTCVTGLLIRKGSSVTGLILITSLFFTAKAQTPQYTPTAAAVKTKAVLFDGVFVAGYVANGGYINCAGPGLKFTRKPYMVLLGLLPSLKIKEDKVPSGATKNAIVTPTLGFGLTAAFKHLALQVPLYYRTKTNLSNGAWQVGIGLGYRL